MPSGLNVAVVEPTTLVGAEIVRILEERDFPLTGLVLLGSRRAVGATLDFRGSAQMVMPAERSSFRGVDLAFMPCDRAMGGVLAGHARDEGAIVVDLSTRHALEDTVPLVVPEVNAGALAGHHGIVAGPRAATVQMVLVLAPIHTAARIRRTTVTSFHAVSEIGGDAMDELTSQIRDIFSFREVGSDVFGQQMAFNVLPPAGTAAPGGYAEEELLIAAETRKILRDRDLRMSVTCVQVPVFYSHGAAVTIETERKLGPADVRALLDKAPGVTVYGEETPGACPTQVQAAGMDECLVGRIREDLGCDNGIALWTVCDNIRKGSALNAVQIAEQLFGTRI